MLKSDLCDYNNAYIVVKGTIFIEARNNRDIKNRSLAFKNNAPFISCISKINNSLIENAEELDIVMPMYNLIEYSKIIEKQQVVYEFVTRINLIILLMITIMQIL